MGWSIDPDPRTARGAPFFRPIRVRPAARLGWIYGKGGKFDEAVATIASNIVSLLDWANGVGDLHAVANTPLDDALEVVDSSEVELFGFDAAGKENFYNGGGSFGIGWSRRLDLEERSRLRALMLGLPNGVPARCHMPGFGLRFGWPRELYVSICFRCNNIYVDRAMVTFDASSAQARQLRAFLQSCAPLNYKSQE